MKLFLFTFFFLSLKTFCADYFTELRLGPQDVYRKIVEHKTDGTLEGSFKKFNFGFRSGFKVNKFSYFFELNPRQKVEIKSASELAKVHSLYFGVRYELPYDFYTGLLLGHAQFELVQGPNGVTFKDNPKTSGVTYAAVVGKQFFFTPHIYAGIDFLYSPGAFKDDGPESNLVESIEVKYHFRPSLSLGYTY